MFGRLTYDVGSRKYYSIFPGRCQQPWTAGPLITKQSVEEFFIPPGIENFEIQKIKMRMRSKGAHCRQLGGETLQNAFSKSWARELLEQSYVYHLKIGFKITQAPELLNVDLSQPGIMATSTKMEPWATKLVGDFLDANGFYKHQTRASDSKYLTFFSQLSRTPDLTMSAADFVEAIGRPFFEYLRGHSILQKSGLAGRIVCNHLKNHKCIQKLYPNAADESFPIKLYCPVRDKTQMIHRDRCQLYTLNEEIFLEHLKRTFFVEPVRVPHVPTIKGIHYLGDTRWRMARTSVYFAYQAGTDVFPLYLEFLKNSPNNVLVLAPSQWNANPSMKERFAPGNKVELAYLDEIMDVANGELNVKERFRREHTVTAKQFKFAHAVTFNQKGKIAVNIDDYQEILRSQHTYDYFLNYRKRTRDGYEGGYRSSRHGWKSVHLTDKQAQFWAMIMSHSGKRLTLHEIFPDENESLRNRKQIENRKRVVNAGRQKMDERLNPLENPRCACFRAAHSKRSFYWFNPPSNASWMLIAPIELQLLH